MNSALPQNPPQKFDQSIFNMFEKVMAGYWDWDIPKNVGYFSPTFKKILGYQEHELGGTAEDWFGIIHPEDQSLVQNAFQEHILSKGKTKYEEEQRYLHKDGSVVWILCNGEIVEWTEEGQPLRMVGCHVNITERKRKDAEIIALKSQYEDQFKGLLEACNRANIGTWKWNLEKDEVHWDKTMLGIYELELSENVTPILAWEKLLHPDDKYGTIAILKRAIEKNQDFNTHFRIITNKGITKHIHGHGYTVYDENGNPTKMMGTNRDITSFFEMERYKRLSDKLRNSIAELQEFSFAASHHLQEPLKNILGFSEVIMNFENENLGDQQKSFLENIHISAEKVSRQINEIYSLTQIGRSSTLEYHDVKDIIEGLPLVQNRINQGQALFLELGDLGEILCDKIHIEKLFHEIIENAIQNKKPDLPLRVKITKQELDNSIEIIISDNGTGISPEKQSLVFQMFKSFSTQGNTPKLGIGLYKCRKIIGELNGSISLKSELNKGTSLTLVFPK